MTEMTVKSSAVDASSEVVVMLSLQFKPGTSEIVERTMFPGVASTRAEEGNLDFQFFRVKDSADRYVLLERWVDQAALDWHWQQDYTKSALALFEEHLASPLSQVRDVTHLIDLLPKET